MLRSYVASSRRFAVGAAVVAVVTAALAFLIGPLLSTPSYSASATIQTTLSGAGSGDVARDQAASAELVSTAQALLVSPRVLGPAGGRLDPPVPAPLMASRIAKDTPPSSLVFVVSTQAESADAARALVQAVAEQFQQELEATPLRSADGRTALEWVSTDYQVGMVGGSDAGIARRLASAALAGLLVGLAYLIARVALDDRLRTHQQVAAITDESVVAFTFPSPTDEQADRLAAQLRFLAPGGGPRTVGIAALTDGARSARLTTSLAAATRRLGEPVRVVDADLRAHPLGASDEGFVDLLLGRDAQPLDGVLRAGAVPANPAELLARADWDAVVARMRGEGWTFVHCTPLLVASDGPMVASRLDAVLVIVAQDVDRRKGLAEALALLDAVRAPVAGLVVQADKLPTVSSPYEAGAGALSR